MERFVPYEKLSKKKKKELDRAKRGTWGCLDPVTRVKPNGKAYNRKKARDRDGSPDASFLLFGPSPSPVHGY